MEIRNVPLKSLRCHPAGGSSLPCPSHEAGNCILTDSKCVALGKRKIQHLLCPRHSTPHFLLGQSPSSHSVPPFQGLPPKCKHSIHTLAKTPRYKDQGLAPPRPHPPGALQFPLEPEVADGGKRLLLARLYNHKEHKQ